jgi:hypothetical protein
MKGNHGTLRSFLAFRQAARYSRILVLLSTGSAEEPEKWVKVIFSSSYTLQHRKR